MWSIGQPVCPAGATTDSASSPRGATSPRVDSASASRTLGDTAGGRKPAIILRASASAREVRFASQPHITVRLCGGTLDSVRVIERRNLPSPVVAGQTYRDVYVAVEILGHLDAACITSRLGAGGAPADTSSCGSLTLGGAAGARSGPPPMERSSP